MKFPIFVRYERFDTLACIDPELMQAQINQSGLTEITIGASFNPRINIVVKVNYPIRHNRKKFQMDKRKVIGLKCVLDSSSKPDFIFTSKPTGTIEPSIVPVGFLILGLIF